MRLIREEATKAEIWAKRHGEALSWLGPQRATRVLPFDLQDTFDAAADAYTGCLREAKVLNEAADIMGESQAPVLDAEALWAALDMLETVKRIWAEEGKREPPLWAGTNAILQALSAEEHKSMAEIVAEANRRDREREKAPA